MFQVEGMLNHYSLPFQNLLKIYNGFYLDIHILLFQPLNGVD
jgi:hypothetical protein